MADLVTQSYVLNVVKAAGTITTPALASLITAASAAVEQFCRQPFAPDRYIELYDAIDQPALIVRHRPILAINSVTLYPTGPNPRVYSGTSFDVRSELGRISFAPNAGDSFYDWYGGAGFPAWGLDAIQVDYTAGWGFLVAAQAAISPGTAVVPVSALAGISQHQSWSIAAGTVLTVDPGLPSAETVTVQAAQNGSLTAVFAQAHGANCLITGLLAPADVQLATALAVGNLINQSDLTKLRESQGKTVGYEYVTRPGDLIITPEIRHLLLPWQDVIV